MNSTDYRLEAGKLKKTRCFYNLGFLQSLLPNHRRHTAIHGSHIKRGLGGNLTCWPNEGNHFQEPFRHVGFTRIFSFIIKAIKKK